MENGGPQIPRQLCPSLCNRAKKKKKKTATHLTCLTAKYMPWNILIHRSTFVELRMKVSKAFHLRTRLCAHSHERPKNAYSYTKNQF